MTVPLSVLQQPITLGELLDAKSFTDVCQSFAVFVCVEEPHGPLDGNPGD